MNPAKTYNEIGLKILENCNVGETITVGILVADGDQNDAKKYIINYMDTFDEKSGKYIDFYIPGYYENSTDEDSDIARKYHPNSYVRKAENLDQYAFSLQRTGASYYFDRILFESFLNDMEKRMGIRYTYNPMLILVEINKSLYRGEIEYQKKLVIELDEDPNMGLRRTGQLFDAIFDSAKKYVHLDRFGEQVRMYYIKGKAINNIVKVLQGEWIEAVADLAADILRFRLK